MPGFDGTGPRGMGAMTGGGRGFCTGFAQNYGVAPAPQGGGQYAPYGMPPQAWGGGFRAPMVGYGGYARRGMGMGPCGMGMAWGRGGGRGGGRGMGGGRRW